MVTKNGKAYMTHEEFAKMHADYKNSSPGNRTIIAYNANIGGTSIYEVEFTGYPGGKNGKIKYQ